jgi:hypothetical protein
MWLHHLFNLLAAAASTFVEAIGTTFLGLWLGIAFALATVLASLWRIRRKHGRQAMLTHWEDDAKIALRVSVVCALIVYCPIAFWSVGKAIYEDHQYLAGFAKKQSITIAQNNAASQVSQTSLQGQISDWRAKCSGLEGANGVLGSQNRAQQNTINNCQSQALKLLTPEGFNIVPIVLEGTKASIDEQHIKWLLLTNKTITPVNLVVTCAKRLTSISAEVIGGGPALSGGNEKFSDVQYEINISSPAWSPKTPLILNVSYIGDQDMTCRFDER